MPKKILLIENDSSFAGTLAEALEGSGFDVRVAAEGKAGLDLAREWAPEGVVLCVELPGMSGYLVCQKLRKDDVTKAIPLILTSAEATEDTFEKHKALKVRADAYLLKPFVPGALLEKLSEVGLPAELEAVPQTTDEISLQPVSGAEDLPALELESLPDEPVEAAPAAAAGGLDDDLAFLDEAFEGIAAPAAGRAAPEAPVEEDDLSAAAASLPDEDEAAGREALGTLELSATEEEDPLAQLDDPEPPPPAPPLRAAPPARTAPAQVRAPSADLLRAAGIPLLDEAQPARPPSPRTTLVGVQPVPAPARTPAIAPPPPAPAHPPRPSAAEALAADRLQRELSEARSAVASRDVELRHLRAQAEEAAQRADSAESSAAEREAELASVRARLEAITGQARRSDQELKGAREEARRATTELQGLRARVEDLERELESTRTEVIVARGEAEGARGEVDARAGELQKRIAELEAQSGKNEERVFKAYQKIKGDEKVKDKVRKAIAIAAQLLEEGLPAEPAAPDQKSKVS
jgi:CheY-like chemotaxis protein/outer membrane murein-binding lipoprotein Lpp